MIADANYLNILLRITKEQLEFNFNKGNVFGFNTENNEKVVGWIRVYKQFPANRFFDIVSEEDDPIAYKAQLKKQNEPYVVNVVQVSREVFDQEEIKNNEDFLLNVVYTFPSLDGAEQFLKELGYSLADLKWRRDYDSL